MPLPDNAVTFAEVIKPAGYAVGGFGKWGAGMVGTTGVPEKQGFDTFFGYYHQVHAHDYYTTYLIRNGEKVEYPENKNSSGPKFRIVDIEKTGRRFSGYTIKNEMFKWIREQKHKPFVCYAPWCAPHGSYEIPQQDPAWQMYKDKDWPMLDRIHAAYVTMVDRQVGELFAMLKELGIDENTIVFFCSDNGASEDFFKSHKSAGQYRGKKTQLYEGGLRSPLIVRWPGKIEPNTVSDHFTYWVDVLPTLAELAGATDHVPDNIDGLSIMPTLLGRNDQEKHEYLYFEWVGYNWRNSPLNRKKLAQAIRVGDWKLLRHGGEKPWELYNLADDPGERNDVAAKHADRVTALEAKIKSVRTDPPPQHEPRTAQPEHKVGE